jgi:RNA-directed DNA polymerase
MFYMISLCVLVIVLKLLYIVKERHITLRVSGAPQAQSATSRNRNLNPVSDPLLLKTIAKAAAERNDPEYIDALVAYGSALESRNLPVIYTPQHLAQLIGIPYTILRNMVIKTDDYYEFYKLRKKTAGYRHIAAPNQQLKYVQRWILKNIIERVEPHIAAQGFRKNHSIKSNAHDHIGKEVILNVDLYRYFDSINDRRIFGLFQWLGYEKNVAWELSKLVTAKMSKQYWEEVTKDGIFSESQLLLKDRTLPQGAPTSPALANLITYRLDVILCNLSNKRGLNYSRYADDLTISGTRDALPPISLVKNIILIQGFYINENKVGFYSQKNRQAVTGITVNQKLSVNRRWKNQLRNELYFCVEKGVADHLKWCSEASGKPIKDNFKDHLYGKICFLIDVEPQIGEKYLELFNKIEWPI